MKKHKIFACPDASHIEPVAPLATIREAKHSRTTCGMSRRGGLIPSQCERQPKQFGRVVVIMSKALPKDGDALGSLKGINARLGPVPPANRSAPMRHMLTVLCALLIAAAAFAPTAAQNSSVDDEFCDRASITEPAIKLTRDWGERFRQTFVEQVAQPGSTARGKVVEAGKSDVLCRIDFSNITTSTYPARRLMLKNVDFRYSEPGGQAQLVPVSLPLSGLDERSVILAFWEKLFIDEKSYRSIIEQQAEHDPKLAAALSEIIGRPKGTENATWEPDKVCAVIGPNGASGAIINWAEKTNRARSTGLTAKETPTWLPPTGWKVTNLKALSSIPFQSVICSADVSYTANKFDGSSIAMEIRGMPYKVWGNDDGSQIFVEAHDWPSEEESRNPENAFNRSWVVNGRTFEQDRAAKKQQSAGQPSNIIDVMTQGQAAYNQRLEAYAKSQGVDVDAMKRAEAEETRKYAEPCRRNGGTWGYPLDRFGNPGKLGCYHPTGER